VADDAGALLVRAGLITDPALASARSAQRHGGGTLGEHLVAARAVSDEGLTEFYRSRLMVPQVSPATLAKLPPAVVALLPADMAVEFRVMPVSLDKDGNLTVAMSDPSDRHAVDEIGFFTGKYVVRAVATQMQIAWCLAHYYDYVTELAERLMQPGAPTARAAAAAPAAPAAPLPTRAKGDTAKVDAARHRVLVPATTPPPIPARPGPEALDRSGPTAIELEADEPDDGAFAPEAPIAPAPTGPTAPTARPAAAPAPARPAAPSPAAALADDAFGGSPTIVVSAEATRPQRTRPAAPDPPELAARSGELHGQVRDGVVDAPSNTVEINLGDEPELEAAVVELSRRRPSTPPPVELVVGGEVSAPAPLVDHEGDDLAVIHDALVDTESALLVCPSGAEPRRCRNGQCSSNRVGGRDDVCVRDALAGPDRDRAVQCVLRASDRRASAAAERPRRIGHPSDGSGPAPDHVARAVRRGCRLVCRSDSRRRWSHRRAG
jgi:hypothetical protein